MLPVSVPIPPTSLYYSRPHTTVEHRPLVRLGINSEPHHTLVNYKSPNSINHSRNQQQTIKS